MRMMCNSVRFVMVHVMCTALNDVSEAVQTLRQPQWLAEGIASGD